MKTKFIFGIFLLLLLFSVYNKLHAQSPSPPWIWAKAINRTIDITSPTIAIDPSGSGEVYTTGSFFGTPDFDPGPDSFNMTSTSLYGEMFISKLDGDGNFVWARQIGGSPPGGSSYGYSIALDTSVSSDIYTTGAFYGIVDFDPGPGTFNIEYTGIGWDTSDIFVSKLDSSGQFIWAKSMGGTGDAFGRSIVVDPSGSGEVYILGSFEGTVDFNPGADSFFLTSVGENDIFISKLDNWGNFLWAKSIGGTKKDFGFSMTFDPTGSGNVYVTGDFSGRVDFDPGTNIYNLNSIAVFDIFILKLNAEGDFVWAKPMWGTNSKGGAGYSIAIDPTSGDVYTTGYFEGEVDFDPGKGIVNLHSHENDIFISKLDSLGNFVWARQMGGAGGDYGRAIAFDPSRGGSIYSMGDFTLTADFDPGLDSFHLTSAQYQPYFISKLDRSGKFEWAKPIKGLQPDQGASIALDGRALYVAGLFLHPSISFDSIFLNNPLDTGSYWDVFIAKLDLLTISVFNVGGKKQQINIYPNPTSDHLTIELDGDECFNVGITLYTILGEVIFSSPVENISHQKTIDISSLTTGIYFIELNIDGNRAVRKVLKE